MIPDAAFVQRCESLILSLGYRAQTTGTVEKDSKLSMYDEQEHTAESMPVVDGSPYLGQSAHNRFVTACKKSK